MVKRIWWREDGGEKMVGRYWGRNYGLVTGGQGGIGRAHTDLRHIKYVMPSTTHWQFNIAKTPKIIITNLSCIPLTVLLAIPSQQ